MARGQAVRQQPSLPKKQGKHPQGIRKSARLQEIQRQRGQATSKKNIRLFPSAPAGNTLGKEVSQRPVPLPAISPPKRSSPDPGPKEIEQTCLPNGHEAGRQPDRKRKQGPESPKVLQRPPVPLPAITPPKESSPDPAPKEVEQTYLPNGHEADRQPDRKRKQGPESPKDQDEPSKKRARVSVEGSTINPIDYWIKEGDWPKEFFEPGIMNMNQLSRKHSFPAISYAQSVKQGDNPPAYTPGHENVLARAGIFMEDYVDPTAISRASKDLCATLLQDKHEPPENSLFEGASFWMVTRRVCSRNERRIERDIMSSITPSAELLYIRGALQLEHLTEELSAEWTRCVPLGGPRPTPDFAVGFMSSAFTPIEVEKLKFHTTPERATQFTEMLYFPFLLCEVKRGEAGLNIADRQNIHSASMAINAIVQLCRAVPEAEDLHQTILAFSISHDHAMVKIYGHYPLIEGNKPTFHRHLIRSFNILEVEGRDRWTAYKFVRQVYDIFAPIHLKRIRRAIAQLPDPITESIVSSVTGETEQELAGMTGSYGLSGSHNMMTKMLPPSVPSSQNLGVFKKPRLSLGVMLQRTIDQLTQEREQSRRETEESKRQSDAQLAQEREQRRRETEESKRQSDAQLAQEREQRRREMEESQQRLDREKEESQQRIDREREESQQRIDREREENKQRHAELVQLLTAQMDRQMDELKREKDELKRERDEMKRAIERAHVT